MLLSSLSRTSFARIQYGVSSSRIYHGKQVIKKDRQLKTVHIFKLSILFMGWETTGQEPSFSTGLTIKMYLATYLEIKYGNNGRDV